MCTWGNWFTTQIYSTLKSRKGLNWYGRRLEKTPSSTNPEWHSISERKGFTNALLKLVYGYETWTLKKANTTKRRQVTQRAMEHCVLGKTRTDRKRLM